MWGAFHAHTLDMVGEKFSTPLHILLIYSLVDESFQPQPRVKAALKREQGNHLREILLQGGGANSRS